MPRRTATVDHTISSSRRSKRSTKAATEEEKTEDETLEGIEEVEESNQIENVDLRDLIFLGKISSTFEISGFSFRVSTLTTAQQRDIYADIMTAESTSRLTEIKPIVLARAIEAVNGAAVETFYKGDEDLDIFDKRYEVIATWQMALVDRLYQEYESLVERTNKDFGIDQIKK
jgi:hypothetical protein